MDAAAAAFATAQTFDELRHGRPRLDPEARKITLGDDATMPTAQAAHRDHPPWTLPFPIRSRGHSITPTQQQLSSGMDIWALIPGNQPVTYGPQARRAGGTGAQLPFAREARRLPNSAGAPGTSKSADYSQEWRSLAIGAAIELAKRAAQLIPD